MRYIHEKLNFGIIDFFLFFLLQHTLFQLAFFNDLYDSISSEKVENQHDNQNICQIGIYCIVKWRCNDDLQCLFRTGALSVIAHGFDSEGIFSGRNFCVVRCFSVFRYNPFFVKTFQFIGVYKLAGRYEIYGHEIYAEKILFIIKFYFLSLIDVCCQG